MTLRQGQKAVQYSPSQLIRIVALCSDTRKVVEHIGPAIKWHHDQVWKGHTGDLRLYYINTFPPFTSYCNFFFGGGGGGGELFVILGNYSRVVYYYVSLFFQDSLEDPRGPLLSPSADWRLSLAGNIEVW